jgi:hypothetical protein
MATNTEVKEYLAKWLQMGKSVSINDAEIKLHQVVKGEEYSPEFEQIWEQSQQQVAYLEGNNQTIQDLLKPEWEIISCATCELPVPKLSLGYREVRSCVCDDDPNLDTIAPRSPVISSIYLQGISDRLN